MTAIKLDGNLYRDEIFADLSTRVAALKAQGITPGLATVLVGDDPASHAFGPFVEIFPQTSVKKTCFGYSTN